MPVSKATASVTAVLAFLIGASAMLVVLERVGAFAPIPYRVLPETVTWEQRGAFVDYRAQFIKDTCTFKFLVIRGEYFGQIDPVPVEYKVAGYEQGDREVGQQGFDVTIGPMRLPYEALELRTRHDCDGEKVDRLFDRIDLQ